MEYNTTYVYHLSNTTPPIRIYFKVKDMAGNVNETSFEVKLPDLSIAPSDISFYPADIVTMGVDVTINVTVHNTGDSDAINVLVEFWKYGTIFMGNDTIYLIPKGGTGNASVVYSQPNTENWFFVYVIIDPHNKVLEVNEDNNMEPRALKFVFPPDVLPLNITFSVPNVEGEPEYLFENDMLKITCNITNQGGEIPKETPFLVEFWLGSFENNTFNGTCIGNSTIDGIKTEEIKYPSIVWSAKVGDYTLMVFLNTTKNILGENVENNKIFRNFTVYPPTAVTLSPFPSLLTTGPLGILSYTITITNIGQVNDTYNLTVEDLPSDWFYSFIYNSNEIKNVTLKPGESIEILLKVKSGDKSGTYHFRVVASSQKDPRAVYDIELTAKIKEPFPWYLLIIAVIAAAVITAVGVLVKTGVLVVKGKPEKVKVEQGYNYLIKGTDVRKAYAVFMQLMKKTPGLCITSTHPRKRRDEYKLKCQIYWLTDVTKTDEKTLHPERLDFELFKTVNDFVTGKHGVIMLDGLEYLVHVNGFERTMDFIDSIRDAISTHKGTLVVPANPSVFKEEELGMLEKRFDRILG
jgi:hypothetical protein